MDIAPATRPAIPAIRTASRDAPDAATDHQARRGDQAIVGSKNRGSKPADVGGTMTLDMHAFAPNSSRLSARARCFRIASTARVQPVWRGDQGWWRSIQFAPNRSRSIAKRFANGVCCNSMNTSPPPANSLYTRSASASASAKIVR